MSDSKSLRKVAFNLHPNDEPGDHVVAKLLDETRLKERGRTMRAFLVAGAALAVIDRRLPVLIAELTTENISLKDIKSIIQSVVPNAFESHEDKLDKLLNRLDENMISKSDVFQASVKPKNSVDKTRENSKKLFNDTE